MKITILPIKKVVEKPDYNTLFNLVKRCEEDLTVLSPSLQEFVISVNVHPTFVGYHNSKKATYKISDDNAVLQLMIDSYDNQNPKIIYEQISDKLTLIKTYLRDL